MKWLVEGDLEMLSHTNGPQQVQPASSVSVNSLIFRLMYTFLTLKSCITLYKTLKYDLVLRTTRPMFLLINWLFIYVSRGQELVIGPTNK